MAVAQESTCSSLLRLSTPNISLAEPPYKIQNNLAEHPLFEDDRIKQLLRNLPAEHIEIREVQQRETNDGAYKRGRRLTDVDAVDAFERLEEKPTWILLHQTWVYDKEYGELLKDYLE